MIKPYSGLIRTFPRDLSRFIDVSRGFPKLVADFFQKNITFSEKGLGVLIFFSYNSTVLSHLSGTYHLSELENSKDFLPVFGTT